MRGRTRKQQHLLELERGLEEIVRDSSDEEIRRTAREALQRVEALRSEESADKPDV